ncbi:PREDICTED: cytoplasmic dynein 2 light intermediate chain 1 isoform X1 [Polistes dominula]|uniref:Cytoplasmic dynein 2 light intermediate chain 1 n=2 Tax=Polistes dominula TaxID=743375 RepID=A0ABM1J9B3_POLDO|nr:PREDICTED: cytoplasmic dynein 2 light intermediate chain 1 isoform X1 [Polistes dominula]XP_015189052.1 PREDICTED: cytoplasmic dynein 2 light intermediate chain 1 isoform X1 [Polistes dominula]
MEKNDRESALRVSMEEEENRKTDPKETRERSIIIIGSKSVGKTTMINRFLEKDEKPKPTIAMEYSFGRKAGKSLVKNIVHVWEIGYVASSLISTAISGSALTHSPHHTTLLMMLDLSKPELLWITFEEILSAVRSALKISYDSKLINDMIECRTNERKNVEKMIDLLPLKTFIIGGKYDEFQDFDLDKKEIIGRTLRAIAHSLGAGLYYYSSKDKILLRKTKDLLCHIGFGAVLSEGKFTSYDKPLIISPGSDSFSSIDLQLPYSKPSMIFDTIKQTFIVRVPQITRNEESTLEDPSNDPNFNEPIIDKLKVQREEEINVLLDDMLNGRTQQIPIPDPV